MERSLPHLETRTRWLIVRLAGVEYALPMDSVRQMMQLRGQKLDPTAVHGPFRYRVRLHNQWLAVAVLHPSLGLKLRPVNARSCLVVADRRLPNGPALPYALIVDSISRMQFFAAGDLQPPDAHSGPSLAGCLGRLRWNDKWHPALDLDALLPWADLASASQAPHAA